MARTIDQAKLDAANKALELFAAGSLITYEPKKGFYINWSIGRSGGKKLWRTALGSFYPIWSGTKDSWPFGGTSQIALTQLIFWLKDEPLLPLGSWVYWQTLGLGPGMADILRSAGYPEVVSCIKCGCIIEPGNLDWCVVGKKSGPGCKKCSCEVKS